MRVSALHPLMADLARQVGGDRVRVFDLVGEGGDPHRFEPRPADMKEMQESALVLAAGKGLEPYIDRLRDALRGVPVIDVGATIPSIKANGESEHEVDPHWWNGVGNMRRAARVVALAFAEKDPADRDYFLANAAAYSVRLEKLKQWAAGELAKVPEARRKLITSHAAFGYFAKEFGFQVIAVAGINPEQNTTPRERAAAIEQIRQSGVRAVFPEITTGAKALQAVASATGVRLGKPLIADGNGTGNDAGFEGMIRHNVRCITEALTAP
jgi:zinc/manganese transport system substrate-binding protein